jgi:hypothetical protein
MQFPSPTSLVDTKNAPHNATAFAASSQRSSGSMALHDPIATHLLVETALGDSRGFEILSFEELDALKKEDALLVSRIDGMRRKLTLETKVRDAARSMNRLYGPTAARRGSGSSPRTETVERAEMELAESTRKCDELGRELYHLEGRSRQTQTRLLRHTAAILQNTYGTGHRSPVDELGLPGGRPYSPDSLDAGQEPDAFDGDDFFLDDDAKMSGTKSTELQKEIAGRLNEANEFAYAVLRQTNPGNTMANLPINSESRSLEATIFEHLRFLGHCIDEMEEERHALTLSSQLASTQRHAPDNYEQMEQKMTAMLVELNKILAGAFTIAAPQDRLPLTPLTSSGSEGQLRYAKELAGRITVASKELIEGAPLPRRGKATQYEAVIQNLWQDMLSGEAKAREADRNHTAEATPPSFSLPAFSAKVRWLAAHAASAPTAQSRLKSRLRTAQGDVAARSASAAADLAEARAALADAQARCAELEREAAQRTAAHGVTQRDLDGLSSRLERAERAAAERATGAQRDADGLREKLERVQAEHANARREADGLRAQMERAGAERSATLRDADGLRAELERAADAHAAALRDADELRAQLDRADSSHDKALRDAEDLRARLERANSAHDKTRRDADDVRARLDRAAAQHATAQRDASSAAQGASARLEAALAQAQRAERTAGERAAEAEKRRREVEEQAARLQREVEAARAQAEEARARQARAVREAEEEAAVMVEGAQGRVKELEAQVAELRAAGEARERKVSAAGAAGLAGAAAVAGGAVGAAAGAANSSARERALREELESTLREFEELTRAGVEAERAREELERTVDRLRDNVESLEARLSEERIGKLGGSKGSPGAEGPPAGSTSTMVLRNEFKKMMKDTRAEHQKALKVCLFVV